MVLSSWEASSGKTGKEDAVPTPGYVSCDQPKFSVEIRGVKRKWYPGNCVRPVGTLETQN